MTAASARPEIAALPPAIGTAPAIECEALTKRYGRARGIEDVSLAVPPGEVLGFLGPNGAGKTTTIRLLLGLLRPSSGRARILGHDTRRDGVAARRATGYLPGDFAIEDSVTGAELLALLAGLRATDDRDGAQVLADRLGADLHRPFGELSRGNRQKVGLVQALAHRPPVLVLDEPTSGLDPLVQETFVELIGEVRAAGAAVLLSSHNLAEVERLCDRVAVLRQGRLVAVETVADMRARAVRNVAVRFEGAAPAGELARVPGVAALQQVGSELRFTVSGELTPLLRAVASHRVTDMEIARPTLEEAFVAAYGEGSRSSTYRSVQGYLDAELFSLVVPLATAWFMVHGLALAVCGAERRGTLDVVLAAPIRRRDYVAGWLGGMTLALVGLLLVLAAVIQLTAVAVGAGLPVGDLLAGVAGLLPLTVFFGGLTLLVAGVCDRAVVVTGVAGGVLVLMYFVHVLAGLSSTVDAVDPLSAFHYYGAAIQDGLDPVRAVGLLAAGVVLAAAGALLFERRDVRT